MTDSPHLSTHLHRCASATYWLPRIEQANLPTPRTIRVPYDHATLTSFVLRLEDTGVVPGYDEPPDDPPELAQAANQIVAACEEVGYPAFVRNDTTSAKREGPTAYRVNKPADAQRVVMGSVGDYALKRIMGAPPTEFLVREWLSLEAAFAAFGWGGEGHPIAREWRFRATADEVVARCFYWPADAMVFRGAEPEGWRENLAYLARPLEEVELGELEGFAVRAAGACPDVEEWSVDFALDLRGKWWLIDMAPAALSWWPEGAS